MDARITATHGAVVCSLAGALHADNEDHLRHVLARSLARSSALLAVDTSAVDLFTASALNVVLTARGQAGRNGVPLVMVAPSRRVQRVLRISDADLVLPVYPTHERAVRHQRRSPAV
ncbi:hypothetical protein GCM10023235_11280 [Kitasatospora terrestris]|uniref:STAS domain-containing protein n=2 Tax=Kitasatospora terrestris TaxID=258051 RepID=A0ABP9DCB8_9ACTN